MNFFVMACLKKYLKKRAASPMFTTIFLLIFALSLGFVLVNLESYAPSNKYVCDGLYDLKVVNVRGIPRACVDSDINDENHSIKLLLTNEAKATTVQGLHVTFIGDAENPLHVIRDYDVVMRPADVVSKRYIYPKAIGELQQVKLSIYRKIGSRVELCGKYSIILDSLPKCEY